MQVGNPETDDSYDYRGILEYAWSHSVIPDQVYDTAKNVCNFENNSWSKECNAAMEIVFDKYKEIDIYNIYAPICLINTTSSVVGSDSHVSSFKVIETSTGHVHEMQHTVFVSTAVL